MKLFKTIVSFIAIVLLLLSLTGLSSCKKKGCTDVTASNFNIDATEDDGSCVYSFCGCTDPLADNYDVDAGCDDGSCVYARAKFIGTYSATENCSSGMYSYVLTISESGADKLTVTLSNVGGIASLVLSATVSGSNIIIPNQTANIQGDTFSFSGTGTLNGNTLSINYATTFNTDVDFCDLTAIKL